MKHDGRSIPHDLLEQYRRSAVELHSQQVQVSVIARSFRVTPQAVYRWLSKARHHGLRALRSTKATGRPPSLTKGQFKRLLGFLRRPASRFGYATDLWSGPRIRHLIKHRLGVHYHSKHMPRLLRRIGLVMKFPERRALEQDPKAVREWKGLRLPAIMADAKRRKALVFYADETLISLIPYVGRTWTFPEVHPVVRVSGKRGQHVGVTGAVNAQGRSCFELTADGERFTACVFIRFLGKIHREFAHRNVTIIADGAPTHKARLVRQYQVRHRKWLRIEILPAYSPELNFSAKAWGFIKTKSRNGSQAANNTELREETVEVLRSLRKNRRRVQEFFSH